MRYTGACNGGGTRSNAFHILTHCISVYYNAATVEPYAFHRVPVRST